MELEHLIELYDVYREINDDIKKEKECVENIFECGVDYESEVRFANNDYEYLNAYNGFFEGCVDELDFLIGEEEVEKAMTLTDLYVEHFGYKLEHTNPYSIDFNPKTIYSKIIDCLIVQVIDEFDLMEDWKRYGKYKYGRDI